MLSNYLQGSCTKYNIVWAEGGGGGGGGGIVVIVGKVILNTENVSRFLTRIVVLTIMLESNNI
jgi:hypothetical protein